MLTRRTGCENLEASHGPCRNTSGEVFVGLVELHIITFPTRFLHQNPWIKSMRTEWRCRYICIINTYCMYMIFGSKHTSQRTLKLTSFSLYPCLSLSLYIYFYEHMLYIYICIRDIAVASLRCTTMQYIY